MFSTDALISHHPYAVVTSGSERGRAGAWTLQCAFPRGDRIDSKNDRSRDAENRHERGHLTRFFSNGTRTGVRHIPDRRIRCLMLLA